ncbi:unnamed protein product [Rotaria magnacalcarata]|uniref:Nuclear receptor domain-containing protein n=1 Tax=Rotaria magnacalcarata TaxID=392030 RepID=A0A815PW63_9BILA|nr:unnamed protein product [Rotaria magnacalcarata]
MAINSEDDVPNMLHDNQLATGSSLDRTPLSEMNKRRKKLTNKHAKSSLHCIVCGDNAFGVNFYAISCESCQELFRQNALRPPDNLHCRGNGDCEVTIEKRKCCKKMSIRSAQKMDSFRAGTHEDVQGRRRRRRRQRYFNKAKFEENLPIDQVHPLNIDDRLLMTESNWSRIHQVQYGYSQAITLNKVIGVPLYPATQSIHSTLELIRIPAYRASIRLITFMKQIPEFDLSDTEDRATLAKHNLLVVVFMHVVLLCNPVADIYHEINTEEVRHFKANIGLKYLAKDSIIN